MEEEHGLVFLIQRYSVQDGPGLRTTIFMKGCPLRCQWCQNPESLNPHPELMTHDTKCILLGKCVEVCPVRAITIDRRKSRKIDRAKCDLCFQCVNACPTKALSKVGEYMTVAEVMAEIERDELFYHRSGGGVTISGGEPLLQWQFVHRLLEACKQRHLHTALDTCGYAQLPVLKKVLENVDLVLYDIKHMAPELHKKVTGKSNRRILNNLRLIPPQKKVWLRLPLIPGFNDSRENITELSRLGQEIGVEKVSILPYHRLAEEKYRQLGMQRKMSRIKPPSKRQLQKIQALIESFGLQVTIGS
ncbi:MAG: glycyl-radical enzyme activating protein [Dehalococcoidales bacterium]|nr:MAG: glycyl-radical enzyme activating protein [Dehalococcoidales bacterium]